MRLFMDELTVPLRDIDVSVLAERAVEPVAVIVVEVAIKKFPGV
jgi:hypothetical protein